MFWVEELNSFKDGFNATKGGEGGSHGEDHVNALYTEDTYYKILEKLANSSDTTTKI